MKIYQNKKGTSGIHAYRIGGDFIIVYFKNTVEKYTYSYSSVLKNGIIHVEKMKQLALAGEGLNTYINKNKEVKNGYERVY